jgi:hypothetical protein
MDSRKTLYNLLKQKYIKDVYVNVFEILNTGSDAKFSTNSNGIFFNLVDVNDDAVNRCVGYLESIDTNLEDHFKSLNIREELENSYKSSLVTKKRVYVNTYKKPEQTKTSVVKPVEKKPLKGVYKRIDQRLKGLKMDEVKIVKKEIKKDSDEEDILKKEDSDDEDLFGEESDEEVEDQEDHEDFETGDDDLEV